MQRSMDPWIDADLRQKKILNFTSVTDEVCTSKDSTVVNKEWEQFLLSGDEISLVQPNLKDLESYGGGGCPLFKLLKSTLAHRPSLKCLRHLNYLQRTLKKGFPFYTEILCWSFTQMVAFCPLWAFHQPWWGSAVSSFLQEVMMKSKRHWNSASAACFASFSLIPKCHLS